MMALHSDEINVYEVVKALEGDFSLFQQMGEKCRKARSRLSVSLTKYRNRWLSPQRYDDQEVV